MLDLHTYIGEERLVTKAFLIISISNLSLFSLIELAQQNPQFFEKFYVFSSRDIITSACFHTTDMDDYFNEICNDITEKMNSLNHPEDGLCTEPKSITTYHIGRAPPPLSVFNSKLTQARPIRHLTKESLKFVSFLIMRDILIQRSNGPKELIEMCATCRSLHKNDKNEVNNIDDFQMNYDPNEAIRYYTETGFLFRTINQVCGTENMEEIYKFRIYISDLHKKLNQLDMEQEENDIKPCIQKVYRGKSIAGSVLQQLTDNKGGLISMNGFLSTTVDPEVASIFADDEMQLDEGHKRVHFEFRIGKEIKLPYAYIADCSTKKHQAEVLFSLGTIWRIESIKHDEHLYIIELTSCEKLDSELAELLRKYTGGNVTLMSLGDILLELGDENEAVWSYRKMLDQQSAVDETTGILHYKIGMIQFEKKFYDEALKNLTEAKRLLEGLENKLNEPMLSRPIYIHCTEPPLLKIYNNIGFMLEKNGRFEEAVVNYERALNEKGSNTELATVHNNLSLLQFHLGNYATAHKHYKKACELIVDSHTWSMEFKQNLKRTNDQLDHIAKNKAQKRNNQKTTIDIVVYESMTG